MSYLMIDAGRYWVNDVVGIDGGWFWADAESLGNLNYKM